MPCCRGLTNPSHCNIFPAVNHFLDGKDICKSVVEGGGGHPSEVVLPGCLSLPLYVLLPSPSFVIKPLTGWTSPPHTLWAFFSSSTLCPSAENLDPEDKMPSGTFDFWLGSTSCLLARGRPLSSPHQPQNVKA